MEAAWLGRHSHEPRCTHPLPKILHQCLLFLVCIFFFFFHDTAPTEIYTLSLHDALPICRASSPPLRNSRVARSSSTASAASFSRTDRKSTRLNSSHVSESRMAASA